MKKMLFVGILTFFLLGGSVSALILPTPGGDVDVWANILNTFLNTSLGVNATVLTVENGTINDHFSVGSSNFFSDGSACFNCTSSLGDVTVADVSTAVFIIAGDIDNSPGEDGGATLILRTDGVDTFDYNITVINLLAATRLESSQEGFIFRIVENGLVGFNQTSPKAAVHVGTGGLRVESDINLQGNLIVNQIAQSCIGGEFFDDYSTDGTLTCNAPIFPVQTPAWISAGGFLVPNVVEGFPDSINVTGEALLGPTNITGDLLFNHSHTRPANTLNTVFQNGNRTIAVYGSIEFVAIDQNTPDVVLATIYSDSNSNPTTGIQDLGLGGFNNFIAIPNDILNISIPFSFYVQPFDYYTINTTISGTPPIATVKYWNEMKL